jgi:hypothetical protein
MSSSSYEITVANDQVNTAIQAGMQKGWVLDTTQPLDEGHMVLTFRRASAVAPRPPADPLNRAIDPNIAWLELFGLIGFLGIGYLVANRIQDGIIRLVGFWILMTVGWIVTVILMTVLIGFCLIPVMLVASVGIPIWSALSLRNELEAQYPYR